MHGFIMDRLNTSHGEQWTHSFLQGQSRKLAHSSHVQLNGTEYYLETELGDVLNHDFSVMQDKKEKGTLTRLLQLLSIQMVEYCVLIVMRNATIEWIILQCCVSMLLGSSSFVFKLFSLNNRMISASDILLMSTSLAFLPLLQNKFFTGFCDGLNNGECIITLSALSTKQPK